MSKLASGTFEVRVLPQPADEKVGDPTVGRLSIDKQFHGDLEATSKGQMLAVGTDVKGSAGYVAMERVAGTLHGQNGTFALQHTGTMTRGAATECHGRARFRDRSTCWPHGQDGYPDRRRQAFVRVRLHTTRNRLTFRPEGPSTKSTPEAPKPPSGRSLDGILPVTSWSPMLPGMTIKVCVRAVLHEDSPDLTNDRGLVLAKVT